MQISLKVVFCDFLAYILGPVIIRASQQSDWIFFALTGHVGTTICPNLRVSSKINELNNLR